MKTIFTVIFISCFYLQACHSKPAGQGGENDSYEKAKVALEEKEKKTPLAFLKVKSHERHNLIGQMVISGEIRAMRGCIEGTWRTGMMPTICCACEHATDRKGV